MLWDPSSFSANRDLPLNECIARSFFGRVRALAQGQERVCDEHFSVDGTLIEAWASLKGFRPKDAMGKPPQEGV